MIVFHQTLTGKALVYALRLIAFRLRQESINL
jgi:hypothetical protein